MKQTIINILLWIWCFPQMLLGLILKCVYKGEKHLYNNIKFYSSKTMKGAISLGSYILIGDDCLSAEIIKHEYGHYKQSLMLGWLYLLIIGIPSFMWCNLIWNGKSDYYSFYTEKWANHLGGVENA